MGLFTALRDERIVFLGLAAATVGVAVLMQALLEVSRDEARVPPTHPKTQYITQETEDALKLGTLDSLLNHYNYSIRETAARIISDRAANDGTTINHLLYGITRPDYDERIRSLKTLALITDHSNLRLLHTQKVCAALVRSLELCLDDVEHERLDDKYFDEYYLRDMAERLCLMFVSQLMAKFDTHLIVQAKFVEKWLAKQRWGEDREARQRNFREYVERKQNRLTEICSELQRSKEGRKALETAGLISKERAGELAAGSTGGFSVVLQISMSGDDEGLGVRFDGGSIPRAQEQSAEEQRLRRQHREAMVLNDGTRPLGRDDIIERSHDSPR